jgi:large subunit ribosomal protein L3
VAAGTAGAHERTEQFMKAILGYKRGMTRVFNERGEVVPVTVIEAGPCVVTQVRTPTRDGYRAVQLGFDDVPAKKLTRAEVGHLKKSGSRTVRHLREFRLGADEQAPNVGTTVDAGVFAAGERVNVTATSRGLGWSGTIKRHHFHRQRKTHGQSDRHRAPGAVGAGTTPGRTFKGHRMAGRMGGERVTTRGVEVVTADPARNLIAIKGSVPGFDGGLVIIRAAQ